MKKKSRRYFQLLEVIIAMLLVALCALPLIQPHLHMYLEQRKSLKSLQVDHLAGFLYADIVGKLYTNELEWHQLMNPALKHSIDTKNKDLENMSYEATYAFKLDKAKPKDEPPEETNYLFDLFINVASKDGKDLREYTYVVFIKRKIKEGQDKNKKPDASEETIGKPKTNKNSKEN